jgi:hypothetical protein
MCKCTHTSYIAHVHINAYIHTWMQPPFFLDSMQVQEMINKEGRVTFDRVKMEEAYENKGKLDEHTQN